MLDGIELRDGPVDQFAEHCIELGSTSPVTPCSSCDEILGVDVGVLLFASRTGGAVRRTSGPSSATGTAPAWPAGATDCVRARARCGAPSVISSSRRRSRFASLERTHRRVGTLVAGLRAGALDGLLDRVRRRARRTRWECRCRRPRARGPRRTGRDEVEMRRGAADHGAERDDRVTALGRGDASRRRTAGRRRPARGPPRSASRLRRGAAACRPRRESGSRRSHR